MRKTTPASTVLGGYIRGVDRKNEGLVGLACGDRFQPRALWTKGKLRKVKSCGVCGESLAVGTEAFAPIGNMRYRMARVCVSCVRVLFEEA